IFSAAAIIYGFGLGIIMTTVSAMCMSSTTPDRRGAASATFQCAMDIGFGVGSLIWGFVAGALGYRPLYGIISVLPVLAIVMCLVIVVKQKK
ncbi:MAG: MFS transporter, partial [Firmicutes bacterium]|nr:MFS transporter [Bacillota bacterium]